MREIMMKKMMRKGDANIWWIIIGAVIALVVLIVIILIFTQKTGGLSTGLSNCEGKSGVCAPPGVCPTNTLAASAFTCTSGNECCVGSPQECGGALLGCPSGQNCIQYGQKSYCR